MWWSSLIRQAVERIVFATAGWVVPRMTFGAAVLAVLGIVFATTGWVVPRMTFGAVVLVVLRIVLNGNSTTLDAFSTFITTTI